MLEAISTSDWHIGGLRKFFPHDHIDRQLKEIDKVYQYALKKNIRHVFVPGDISDSPFLEDKAIISLINLLLKYDGKINTYYIAGNHDFSDTRKTSLDVLSLLSREGFFSSFFIYLQPAREVINSVPINFLPFPCHKTLSNKPALNFVHIEYPGCVDDNGRVMKGHSFKKNPGDFTVSGHIHKHQYLKSQRVLYNGSLYQKNFAEELPKGFIHFQAINNNGIKLKYKFIDNKPEFELQKLEINKESDFKQLRTDIIYKLIVADHIIVPANFTVNYPNIHSISAKGNNISAPEQQKSLSISPLTGLSRYLDSYGLNRTEIKTARSMVKEALNELNLN